MKKQVLLTVVMALAIFGSCQKETINVTSADFTYNLEDLYYPGDTKGYDVFFSVKEYGYEGTTYLWEFGDGSSSSVAEGVVSHEYEFSGEYTVKLSVTGSDGSYAEKTRTIAVLGGDEKIICYNDGGSIPVAGYTAKLYRNFEDYEDDMFVLSEQLSNELGIVIFKHLVIFDEYYIRIVKNIEGGGYYDNSESSYWFTPIIDGENIFETYLKYYSK